MGIITKPKKISRPDLTNVTSGNSGNLAFQCEFHPNNNFIAVVGESTSKQLAVWSWNGSTTVSEVETIDAGSWLNSVSWHPNGNFLATAEYNDSTNSIVVYSWNGTDTLTAVETAAITGGATGCKWSPNGNFLATGSYNTSESINVYSWNGTDTLTLVETINLGVWNFAALWSPDGNYLAACPYNTTKDLIVYSWNGSDTLTEVASYNTSGSGVAFYTPRWLYSGANTYISFAGNGSTQSVITLLFNGSTLTLKDTQNLGAGARGLALWNNRYLAVGLNYGDAASQQVLRLLKWNPSTESYTSVDTMTYTAGAACVCDFQANGRYLAVPMSYESGVTFRVVKVFDHP